MCVKLHLYKFCVKSRNEGYDLSVFFNLYCVTKKSNNDALEMETILKEELFERFPQTVLVDPASIEVRGTVRFFAILPYF